MRKSLLLLAGVLSLGSLSAQTKYEDQTSKFTDNWSIGVSAGILSPLTHHSFFDNARANMGVNINKQFSPIYGVTIENMWSIKTKSQWSMNQLESNAFFDVSDLAVLNRFNLMNIFAGYKGKPRLFEIEAVYGIGWMHVNDAYYVDEEYIDGNWVSAKAGLNLNFNLGESKAWTIAIKPAIIWNTTIPGQDHLGYNANYAAWDISAGFVYHFKNSNGTHYYSNACKYAGEIEALNATISNLQGEIEGKDRALHNAQGTINDLQRQLDECRNRKVEPVKQVLPPRNEYLVSFRQSSSKVDATQKASVERLAGFLKENDKAKVVITGYASPEGNADYNQKLSEKRAEAVKKILVDEYGIDADRVSAEGKGVGTIFETAKYNRVSIAVTE